MIMVNSEIIDYYPADFKTDLNGKQQEWEAVVLIPFIDEVYYCLQSILDYVAVTKVYFSINNYMIGTQ